MRLEFFCLFFLVLYGEVVNFRECFSFLVVSGFDFFKFSVVVVLSMFSGRGGGSLVLFFGFVFEVVRWMVSCVVGESCLV